MSDFGGESEDASEMPLTCSEDLQSFVHLTYQQRSLCPRLIVKVNEETAVKKSVPRNVTIKSSRSKMTESDASSI